MTRHLKKIPLGIKPMLAKLVREPFHKPGWVYEEKYDGDRILAYKEGDQVPLLSRKAIDRKKGFPHVVTAIRSLRAATLLLDGEMVVFDRNSISRFQLLQQGKGEPVYAVFDCLFREGKDLPTEPLSARHAAMEESIGSGRLLLPSRRLAKNGLEAFRAAKHRRIEGLVAKDLSQEIPPAGQEKLGLGRTAARKGSRFLASPFRGSNLLSRMDSGYEASSAGLSRFA